MFLSWPLTFTTLTYRNVLDMDWKPQNPKLLNWNLEVNHVYSTLTERYWWRMWCFSVREQTVTVSSDWDGTWVWLSYFQQFFVALYIGFILDEVGRPAGRVSSCWFELLHPHQSLCSSDRLQIWALIWDQLYSCASSQCVWTLQAPDQCVCVCWWCLFLSLGTVDVRLLRPEHHVCQGHLRWVDVCVCVFSLRASVGWHTRYELCINECELL